VGLVGCNDGVVASVRERVIIAQQSLITEIIQFRLQEGEVK